MGKFSMNSVRPKEDHGDRLGIKGFSLMAQSLLAVNMDAWPSCPPVVLCSEPWLL